LALSLLLPTIPVCCKAAAAGNSRLKFNSNKRNGSWSINATSDWANDNLCTSGMVLPEVHLAPLFDSLEERKRKL